MRVSTATSSRNDGRMYTVVVQGYGSAQPRNAQRSISVPFSRLQNLMQSVSQLGGKVLAVTDPCGGPQPGARAGCEQACPRQSRRGPR
jgi:ferredoxin--NADP+ reductase